MDHCMWIHFLHFNCSGTTIDLLHQQVCIFPYIPKQQKFALNTEYEIAINSNCINKKYSNQMSTQYFKQNFALLNRSVSLKVLAQNSNMCSTVRSHCVLCAAIQSCRARAKFNPFITAHKIIIILSCSFELTTIFLVIKLCLNDFKNAVKYIVVIFMSSPINISA